MAIARFSKFSPGGNDTVFLHGPGSATKALAILGGEQAGFVDPGARRLEMAAGEFCVNASRAFGALLDLDQGKAAAPARHYRIRVSGWESPLELEVTGEMPEWQVSAHLDLPPCAPQSLDSRHSLARLPGISHLLYFDSEFRFESLDAFKLEAEGKRRAFGLEDEAALGIVHCRELGAGEYQVIPYVVVPAVGTAMIEGCCGSASLALGLHLHKMGRRGNFVFHQPKSSLQVKLEESGAGLRASISGPVTFMLRGEINLDISQGEANVRDNRLCRAQAGRACGYGGAGKAGVPRL